MAATYRLEALQVILNSLPHLYGTAMVLLDNEMNIISSALWALSMSNPNRVASLSAGGGSKGETSSDQNSDNERGDDDKGDGSKAYQSRDFSIRSVPDGYVLTPAEHARGCTLGTAIRLQRVPVTGYEYALEGGNSIPRFVDVRVRDLLCLHSIYSFGYRPLITLQRRHPQLLQPPPLSPADGGGGYGGPTEDHANRGGSHVLIVTPAPAAPSPTPAATAAKHSSLITISPSSRNSRGSTARDRPRATLAALRR